MRSCLFSYALDALLVRAWNGLLLALLPFYGGPPRAIFYFPGLSSPAPRGLVVPDSDFYEIAKPLELDRTAIFTPQLDGICQIGNRVTPVTRLTVLTY